MQAKNIQALTTRPDRGSFSLSSLTGGEGRGEEADKNCANQ